MVGAFAVGTILAASSGAEQTNSFPSQDSFSIIQQNNIFNPNRRPEFVSAPVVIEDEVWIGYNATILKGIHIGKGAIIQPGAVVVKDVAARTVMAGNPAKVVDTIKDYEIRPIS